MMIPMQQGTESLERFTLLLKIANKFNENTKTALTQHFVNGMDIELVCYTYSIHQPNLQRSINRINEVNGLIEQIKHVDLYHLTDRVPANDSQMVGHSA
ncbi:hypothetical protein EYS14_03520 [Alteromonadaceae bacterium M269]|nr:hypothetical protein EYS14_03520 [Alteromonadaceae bacterium M269]